MSKEKNNELNQRIEQALETVRPYLLTDGGDVKLVEVTDDLVVKLELLGSCQNCPMSTMTFRAGLEEAIRRAAPEITKVEATNVEALA